MRREIVRLSDEMPGHCSIGDPASPEVSKHISSSAREKTHDPSSVRPLIHRSSRRRRDRSTIAVPGRVPVSIPHRRVRLLAHILPSAVPLLRRVHRGLTVRLALLAIPVLRRGAVVRRLGGLVATFASATAEEGGDDEEDDDCDDDGDGDRDCKDGQSTVIEGRGGTHSGGSGGTSSWPSRLPIRSGRPSSRTSQSLRRIVSCEQGSSRKEDSQPQGVPSRKL